MARAKAPDPARVARVLDTLARTYPDAACALDFRDPYELLVATILSAQCTDRRVNQVTPALFAAYPDPAALAAADAGDVIEIIRSTGFFRNKAKNIIGACQAIVARHGGRVPGTLEELVQLPGVGRKTANVVLGDAFGVPGITVDTHLGRVCRRLALTENEDPVKVETDLMRIVPRDQWTVFSHQVIHHGRALCAARKPLCSQCPLAPDCPSA
ncbi:MAG: endonuclease III [Nitrospirae bacterium]|nr:endonuclease III [Nitrospirota bacterium]